MRPYPHIRTTSGSCSRNVPKKAGLAASAANGHFIMPSVTSVDQMHGNAANGPFAGLHRSIQPPAPRSAPGHLLQRGQTNAAARLSSRMSPICSLLRHKRTSAMEMYSVQRDGIE